MEAPRAYWPNGRHGAVVIAVEGEDTARRLAALLVAERAAGNPTAAQAAAVGVPELTDEMADQLAIEARAAGAVLSYLVLTDSDAAWTFAERLAGAFVDAGLIAPAFAPVPVSLDFADLIPTLAPEAGALWDVLHTLWIASFDEGSLVAHILAISDPSALGEAATASDLRSGA